MDIDRTFHRRTASRHLTGAACVLAALLSACSSGEGVTGNSTTGGDSVPPSVSIAAPLDGATVSGTVTVSATATDNVSVAGVQFVLDGATLIGAEDIAAPYAVAWATSGTTNGTHTLTAIARDGAGNLTASLAVTVQVSNSAPPPPGDTTRPTVSFTAPAAGATVSGSVTVSASASDNVGVAGVQFLVDGNRLLADDTTAPYSFSWNTATESNGSHTLTAIARDAAGNLSTVATRTVTVSNDASMPSVSISAPANAATVAGSVTVSASASDNVAVVGVQFKLDGANLGAEDFAAPYSVTWDTTTVANGSHALTAVARDAAGNTRTSAAVNVTVNNAQTNSATLSWDPNVESDLAGYRVYYGTSPGTYQQPRGSGVSVSSSPHTVTGLTRGVRYYFAVTAYDHSGNESDFSQEVFKDIP